MEQLLVNVKDIDDQIERIRKLKHDNGSVETLRSQEIIQLNWIRYLGVALSPDLIVIPKEELENILGDLHKQTSKARNLGQKYNILIYQAKKEQVYYILKVATVFPTEKIVKTKQVQVSEHDAPFYTPFEQYNAETNEWERKDPWESPIKNLYQGFHPNDII